MCLCVERDAVLSRVERERRQRERKRDSLRFSLGRNLGTVYTDVNFGLELTADLCCRGGWQG